MNIDGGARGNPGSAGFGVYVRDEEGDEVDSLYGYLGEQTNNVAEYAALLAALRYALGRGARRVKILSDSELWSGRSTDSIGSRTPASSSSTWPPCA